MTSRIILLDLDSSVGNNLYWLLKELMSKYPNEIRELKERTTKPMTDEKALAELLKVREYYSMNRQGYDNVIKWLEGRIKRRSKSV